jgi:hypothetical protein
MCLTFDVAKVVSTRFIPRRVNGVAALATLSVSRTSSVSRSTSIKTTGYIEQKATMISCNLFNTAVAICILHYFPLAKKEQKTGTEGFLLRFPAKLPVAHLNES